MKKKRKKKNQSVSSNEKAIYRAELSNEKQRRLFYLTILFIFCLIFLLNCLTPMAADDYSYSFINGTNERVDSFSDVFISEWKHYFDWGGRIVVHSIAQIFLWWGKPIFNPFNSIMFIIYISLISFLAFGKKSAVGIVSVFLLVWFILPVPSSVFLWLVGSCNYLWGTTFIFLLIYQYYNSILENKASSEQGSERPVWFALLWFLFGMIAGWCNENTSGMGILVCCLLTLYKYLTTKKISLWHITGIAGAVLGFVLMIAAPGNYQRATHFSVSSNPFRRIFEGIVRANAYTFNAKGIYGIIFYLFLFTYLFIFILPVKNERKFIGGIWFLGALACNYAMALSPYYPIRASCGVFSMYFVSILYAGRTLVEFCNSKTLVNVAKVLLCASCLYFTVSYSMAARDIGSTYIRNKQRIETVLEEKSKGNYDVFVPRIYPYTKYNVFSSVADWPDYSVAPYFEVNSINLI